MRRDKGGGGFRKVEAAEFGEYTCTLVLYLINLLAGDLIAEGDIMVGHLEEDAEGTSVLVLEIQCQG